MEPREGSFYLSLSILCDRGRTTSSASLESPLSSRGFWCWITFFPPWELMWSQGVTQWEWLSRMSTSQKERGRILLCECLGSWLKVTFCVTKRSTHTTPPESNPDTLHFVKLIPPFIDSVTKNRFNNPKFVWLSICPLHFLSFSHFQFFLSANRSWFNKVNVMTIAVFEF